MTLRHCSCPENLNTSGGFSTVYGTLVYGHVFVARRIAFTVPVRMAISVDEVSAAWCGVVGCVVYASVF